MKITLNDSRSLSLKSALSKLGASLLTSTLCLAVQAPVQAQPVQASRIGYVKFERIIKESAAAKLIQTKLEQEFSIREKDINAQDAEFKTAADKFQSEAPVMPETQRSATRQKLAEQERELQRKRRAFQEDLNTRKKEELQKLLNSANQTIKKLAEAEKLDFVVQDAVYVSPRSDMTDRVLKAMDAKSSK
jgi:outer membrane protein